MTRSLGHLTPRYVVARANDAAHQALHRDEPWLTPDSVKFLSQTLRSSDVGLEFGSGRSTLWLASRLAYLVSVESDRVWFDRVQETLRESGHRDDRVSLVFAEQPDEYLAMPPGLDGLDFCLIDGKYRDRCARLAARIVKPGGLLVVDDAHRYLPNDATHAPLARRSGDGPASEEWAAFLDDTASWRRYWSTNGVKDTYVFIRSE